MEIESKSYKKAGVNIDLAHDFLKGVKSKIRATYGPEVIGPRGSFGGFFQLDLSKFKEPILVSSVDGVGTKLLVASLMNQHRQIGFDLVNHCVNDIACQGAEPLYFMDYLGIGRLRNPLFKDVLSGLSEACAAQNMALLGGETAEMPGMYGDHYDLVGAITGIVEKSNVITGENIAIGDTILGLASNGLHTNGYSLARKVLFEQCKFDCNTPLKGSGESIGRALLKCHICYYPAIKDALENNFPLHGIGHITGGGLYDNLARILPENVDAHLTPEKNFCPEIFQLIQEKGEISDREMYKVFNMGIGMTWVLPPGKIEVARNICEKLGFHTAKIGEIVAGSGKVGICGLDF